MKSLRPLSHFSSKTPFLYSLLSSLSTVSKTPSPLVLDYLAKTFNFPESTSNVLAARVPYLKSLERPKAVVQYLQNLGFSDKQIQSLVRGAPQILSADVDKILKPKIGVFQQLGLDGFSLETFEKKFQIFESFGFSKDEYMEMVKRMPYLLNNSVEKSKIGLDFYLNTVKSSKEEIISKPAALMYSMENRVLPRYRVYQIIKSKQLSENMNKFLYLMYMSEDAFMEKVILRFPGNAEELLKAFKGETVDPYSREKVSKS